jgi:very-short-patch-repair endonuclease
VRVVEIDGPQHNTPAGRRDDATRDRVFAAAGYTTLRFTDEDVKYRSGEVLKAVSEWVSNRGTRRAA